MIIFIIIILGFLKFLINFLLFYVINYKFDFFFLLVLNIVVIVLFLVELVMIMDRLYGGVCYVGIDIDFELKYFKGVGRVVFFN